MKKTLIALVIAGAIAAAPAAASAQTFDYAQIQAFLAAYMKLQTKQAPAPAPQPAQVIKKAEPPVDYDLLYVQNTYRGQSRITAIWREGNLIKMSSRSGQHLQVDTTKSNWKASLELAATRLK